MSVNACGTVQLELPSTRLGAGEVVLVAALRLLPDSIRLVLILRGVVGEPTAEQIDFVLRLCRRLAPEGHAVCVSGESDLAVPGTGDAPLARIIASDDPDAVVSAVVALTAISQAIRVASTTVRVEQVHAALWDG